jgi:hypothetical protein
MTPALIFNRPASAGKVHGKSIGPVVILPYDAPPHLRAHELKHVRQWWLATILSAFVLAAVSYAVPPLPYHIIGLSIGVYGALYRLAWFRFRIEAAAYAVSAQIAPTEKKRFARALAAEYGTGRSAADATSAIDDRLR